MSSDGPFARKHLRECDGLIEALLKVTHAVLNTQEKGQFRFARTKLQTHSYFSRRSCYAALVMARM